jgi:hypothetical protein
MEISSKFFTPDITDWWHKQEERHIKYANQSNLAWDIVCIIQHAVSVEAGCSLSADGIGRRQTKATGETLSGKDDTWRYPQDNNGIMAGDDPTSDAINLENDLTIQIEVEERILHRMAKLHDHNMLQMWQASQSLWVTQKESRAQNKQMTAMGYILDMEEMIKSIRSLFQHDGVAAFELTERSPLPPAWSAKHILGGRNQLFNVYQIK